MVSIALAAALAVVASAALAEWRGSDDGGWFMYSPNSTEFYTPSSGGSSVRTVLVWLGAVAVWFAVSWRLFRSDEDKP